MILGEDGVKMSKSRGNVINPDDIVNSFGADTMRMYEMFMGDFEKAAPWKSSSIKGCTRFLERVWALQEVLVDTEGYSSELESAMHKTIRKVTNDIENLAFNTAIAALMTLLNDIADKKQITRGEYKTLLLLLNPFAPHITEELWEICGFEGMVFQQSWPTYDEEKCIDETVEIAIQISGKLRGRVSIPMNSDNAQALAAVKAVPEIDAAISGKTIVKEIVVPNKLVNIVVK